MQNMVFIGRFFLPPPPDVIIIMSRVSHSLSSPSCLLSVYDYVFTDWCSVGYCGIVRISVEYNLLLSMGWTFATMMNISQTIKLIYTINRCFPNGHWTKCEQKKTEQIQEKYKQRHPAKWKNKKTNRQNKRFTNVYMQFVYVWLSVYHMWENHDGLYYIDGDFLIH